MKELYITANVIMRRNPCNRYDYELVDTLMPASGVVTDAQQIFDAPIPDEDRIWLLTTDLVLNYDERLVLAEKLRTMMSDLRCNYCLKKTEDVDLSPDIDLLISGNTFYDNDLQILSTCYIKAYLVFAEKMNAKGICYDTEKIYDKMIMKEIKHILYT